MPQVILNLTVAKLQRLAEVYNITTIEELIEILKKKLKDDELADRQAKKYIELESLRKDQEEIDKTIVETITEDNDLVT